MVKHAQFMEEEFGKIQKLIIDKVDEEEKYTELVVRVSKQMEWYASRAEVAASMSRAANTGGAAKKVKKGGRVQK